MTPKCSQNATRGSAGKNHQNLSVFDNQNAPKIFKKHLKMYPKKHLKSISKSISKAFQKHLKSNSKL